MANGKLTFEKLIQDSQDLGSDDDHMVSRAFCTVEVGGQSTETHLDIKQPVGGSFESDQLEVSLAGDYDGPVNYEAMREAAENYYRSLVGSSGSGINIQGGSNIRMRNNTFIQRQSFDIDVGSGDAGW